ncbi:hypothetical protein [Thalassolituus sp. UBA2590]|uniref:hypothetical protein n=1 Tax=Thalassolituus sp. UBA2590 TaxID=1947663 RepID=UPI0026483249|nr:hypothetical protein [Thalassolituus sp. UBA2590]
MFELHRQTSLACFWMLLGSFLPMIVEAALKNWMFSMGYWVAFKSTLRGGEVFILTTAMITPFFWLLIKKVAGKVNNKFRMFGFILLFSLVSLIGGVGTFSYYRIGQLISSQDLGLDDKTLGYLNSIFSHDLIYVAYIIYFISLLVWYYSAYYENNTSVDFMNSVSKDQKSLSEKVFR